MYPGATRAPVRLLLASGLHSLAVGGLLDAVCAAREVPDYEHLRDSSLRCTLLSELQPFGSGSEFLGIQRGRR